ncbi:MAG: deoxyribodipyrimidine photolyase [Candidatus Melainabacteria bacterium]|nr:MAG: deoxyribodipyrimidine photolyase [Candidatus Melainabacteria bacterium]
MRKPLAIVWFRNDLRLADNPALSRAVKGGFEILPVYVHSPEDEGQWFAGAASRWWLHHSLVALEQSLKDTGHRLVLRKGRAGIELMRIIQETSATTIFFNHRYEPWAREQENNVASALSKTGITIFGFDSSLLFPPTQITSSDGSPYKVFTPFWRKLLSIPEVNHPIATPHLPPAHPPHLSSINLNALELLPTFDWAAGLRASWQPGENAATRRLKSFLKSCLSDYQDSRDRPDLDGVSRLSPYLHFGEISPLTVWHSVKQHAQNKPGLDASCKSYLKELVWREFAYHLLYHFPKTTDVPMRAEFDRFPWSSKASFLKAWQAGNTGYPIVDAGIRQLWNTGWMHNRVRMIVASFLVKDLLVSWQDGAKWFWDTLVDADLANNTLGWQWSAGCGADAAPYFRIFNPVLQGKKFDPSGDYVRRWVPELAGLPAKWMHCPWMAPQVELARAGIKLGGSYPLPLVDHSEARLRALIAFETIKRAR